MQTQGNDITPTPTAELLILPDAENLSVVTPTFPATYEQWPAPAVEPRGQQGLTFEAPWYTKPASANGTAAPAATARSQQSNGGTGSIFGSIPQVVYLMLYSACAIVLVFVCYLFARKQL